MTPTIRPYSILAVGYDLVMSHVDYDLWAKYIFGLLRHFRPDAKTVLELGCGTGSFAMALQPYGSYEYLATDGSREMIRVAQEKARRSHAPVRFEIAEFGSFSVSSPVDVIILLYDGLNYLLYEDEVIQLFDRSFRALHPGGIFLFDQSTPANSENNVALFEDQNTLEDFSYSRSSRYDPITRYHTTIFDLAVGDRQFREQHVQRAYDIDEINVLVRKSGFEVLAAYQDFTREPATEKSERVHWIVRRPVVQERV